jgi:hypothetical protein
MNSIYQEKSTRILPPQKRYLTKVKTTSLIKSAEKVPNFAARWCSLCKNLTHSKTDQPGKIMRNTTVKRIFAERLSSTEAEFKPFVSKPLLFSFLLKKQNKHTQVHGSDAIRAAKR